VRKGFFVTADKPSNLQMHFALSFLRGRDPELIVIPDSNSSAMVFRAPNELKLLASSYFVK
jgi:hypothetical protein